MGKLRWYFSEIKTYSGYLYSCSNTFMSFCSLYINNYLLKINKIKRFYKNK